MPRLVDCTVSCVGNLEKRRRFKVCLHMNLLRLCTAVVFSASIGSHNPKLPIIPHVVCLFTCKRRAECMKQDIKFQMDLLQDLQLGRDVQHLLQAAAAPSRREPPARRRRFRARTSESFFTEMTDFEFHRTTWLVILTFNNEISLDISTYLPGCL